ncbi:MAG: c-type cytochrome [Candidatus Binataceae bacterium]
MTAAQRGRVIYRQDCISCHNENPRLPGAVGPPIAGSSRTLLRARLIHHSYPPGYHPKRHTHIMRAMPWLASDINDIAVYLAEAAHPTPSASPLQVMPKATPTTSPSTSPLIASPVPLQAMPSG